MDLVDRDDVSENGILEELRVRFQRDEIYSSIGPIIIALNPYKNITDLYSTKNMNVYMATEHTGVIGYHKHPPHVWTIAQSAFSHLKKTNLCQAIVISGESGAGKTEATKKCLQFLSAIAQSMNPPSPKSLKKNEVPVEDRVLETNPILESFGNSKTSRNNNSSRFGKWIDISFRYDASGQNIQLVGAHITQYLLEKSRVVVQSSEERNYHIFYQLCTDPKWGLSSPGDYHYLNQSGCLVVDGVDDKEEFQLTLKSFDNLGFSETMKNTILSALKAILLLGNVDIIANKAATAGEGTTSSRLVIIPRESERLLEEVAVLLGLPIEVFNLSLTIRSMTVRGETTRIPLDYVASLDVKNALAKEIYGRLFSQIVQQANISLQPPTSLSSSFADSIDNELLSIGLLDIFGFEKFKINSFEQLCINYANEKLQQYFINYVLKKEQELYEAEGIDYTKVVPIDNEDVLYLIEDRKKGIFAKLDDELKLPKSSDETFLKKIEQEHNSKNANRRFLKDIKMGKTQFEIRHFAGVIRYDVKGFMDKNKDKLFDHLEELICESTNLPFRQIMIDQGPAGALAAQVASGSESTSSGRDNASVTISSRFTSQLNKLMNVLDNSQPHFIKCIKPNNVKKPAIFDQEMILLQLRYSGVLEAIMIRKSGYPTRRKHIDFRKSFWMLARISKMKLSSVEDEERKCRFIVNALAEKNPEAYGDIKVGKTLVFLKPNVIQVLEDEKKQRGALAVLFLQSAARRRHDVKRFKKLCAGRSQLRACVQEGKLKNSGNVDAIAALTAAISHCRNVINLICHEVSEAEKLLSRLLEVQDCLNQIRTCLSQQNNSSSASYNDVITEYTTLNKILDTALKLNISDSQLTDIKARVEVLKERASAVLNLRTAIDEGDETALVDALAVIDKLKLVHGAFCDTDEKYGRDIQSKIKEENKIIMASLEKLSTFQSSYLTKLEESVGNKGRERAHSWLLENLASSSAAVKQFISPYMTAPAVCSVSIECFKMMKILLNLHEYWSKKQWSSLADTVILLVNEKKVLLERQKALANPSAAFEQLMDLNDCYLSLVEVDTNRNYLQPLICESLVKGQVTGAVGKIDYNAIDFESLTVTLDEIKQFCWNHDKLKPLFHKIEYLIELRSACQEERIDSILRLRATTQHAEDNILRSKEFNRQMTAIKKLLPGSSEDETENAVMLPDYVKALIVKNQQYIDSNAFDAIKEEFGEAFEMIDKECEVIHADAVDKDIRKRISPILSIGSALQIEQMTEENKENVALLVNSGPLTLLLQEIDFIEQQAASLGFKSVTSEVTITLLKCVEMLLELRKLLISSDYGIIVELCESNKLIVLSSIAEENELSRQLLELGSFLLIKDEAMRIICIAFNAVAAQLFVLSLKHGSIQGKLGRKDKAVIDFAMLEANIAYCQQHATKLIDYGEVMSEEYDTLKAICLLVVDIRKLYVESVIDVPRIKTLIEELQTYSHIYAFPPELEKEIFDLSRELEYDACVKTIEKIFDVPSIEMVYLIPFIKSRKRTISTSKNKSVGFDVTTSHTSDGVVTVTHTLDDIEDILQEEERMLNDIALETEDINVALDEVTLIKDIIPAEDLPEEFEHMVTSLELIKRMRECVKRGDWIQAQKTLSEINSKNLVTLAPMIEKEVTTCGEMVNNYAVIAACKSALIKNQPTGIIGQMDYKSVSIEYMEEAITLCQSIGFKSPRSEALFKAVLIVTDLRRAQKVGDWGAIKTALQRAANENIGRGMTSLCLGEINRSVIELENYDAIQQLKKAIILEEVFTKDCLLDLDHASIQILSESYQKAQQVNEDSRGAILKALISLTEVLLKSRKAAIQKNWTLLEDCISLVKDHLEQFHNEIEKIDMIPRNKTHSFRASAITMTKSPPPPQRGSVAAKETAAALAEGMGSPVAQKISAWDEFAELNVSVKREIKSIELHFNVIALENHMVNALKEGGVKAEVIGKVDLKQIKIDELQAVIDAKMELETMNHSLPASLKQRSKVVHLMLDIRTAILQDKWEEVSKLLEIALDGQMGNLPEQSRTEIAVVRLEIENKQIIKTLNNALQIGKLDGEVGKTNLAVVACEHLVNNISFCKSLQPRTTTAVLLLHTAEVMYNMRRLICNPDPKNTSPHVIKWAVVSNMAKDLIAEVQAGRVHQCVLVELRLFLATAEDTMLCNAMTDALEHGGPSGQPGLIGIDTIKLDALEGACQLAIQSNNSVKTERVSQLFTACRTMKTIREALFRTEPPDTDRAVEAWNSIRELTATILEIRRKNASDMSWSSCREEISLVTKHGHIQQIRTSLIECIIKTSRVYAERNAMNVSDSVPNASLLASVEELDAIVAYSHHLDFENHFMTQFLDCAKALKMMRVAITDENWPNLKELTRDRDLFASLKVLPEAVKEFAWINCELHNRMAFGIIQDALQPSTSGIASPMKLPPLPSPASPKQRGASVADTQFDEQNLKLETALKEVEKYKITSKSTLQLLECCTNVLLLRKSLRNQDNVQVAKSLRWFKANVHLCPPHVQLEAQESYVMHQNDLLTKELTKALQRGKPSGLRGELNLNTIDTESLLKLIEQSVDVIPKTPEVEDLLEAADIALTIRTALRDQNIPGLKDVIDLLSIKDSGFNLLIVDEIATARGEVDNEIVVLTLIESLKSFDDTESKALDLSFLNKEEIEDYYLEPEAAAIIEAQKPKIPGMSMLNSFNVRRYSFANKNNANIDPDTIDVEVLDRSIRVANDHGVYSVKARRLYKTVTLIRSLRNTMKASDWPKLQELVNEAKFDEKLNDWYDPLACKEMQAIRSQLEMRAAVVDLSKALKIGWAKCSNGIVNTSQLCNDVLANAIERADRSITELSMKSDGEVDEVSPVQQQVQLLMTSARLVLKIRDSLLNGNMEAAGALAGEGLSGTLHYSVVEELTLYSKEIDAALNTMTVFQSLRGGMIKGNIKQLEKLIKLAREFQLQYANDLGLVRTLEIAMRAYDTLLMARQALIQCTRDEFNMDVIQQTIKIAEKLNLQSKEVKYAKDKLERVSMFEQFVSELTLSNFGVLTERESFEQLVEKSDELGLARHPISVKARVMLALTKATFHTAVVADSFVHSSMFNIATETIQFKRMYLELSSSQLKYKLENFRNLRIPEEYAMRMNICCEDLKKNMLLHSDQSLPTSLTQQSPVVAALSVWVFIHCIRGIEKQMYTTPEVMLAKLVQLGRTYIPMRDEILLQCIKQIRNNKDVEATKRVWRILSCCLYHFPPSDEFESYLELFLFIYAESSQFSSFSRQCIRFMHQSIFRFGYNRKIKTKVDKSVDIFHAWLTPSSNYYIPPQSEKDKSTHAYYRFNDVFVNPVHDIAFKGYGASPPVPVTPPEKGPSYIAIKHHSIVGSGVTHEAAVAAATPPPVATVYIRGSREDWINRFKVFNQDFGHKDGGHMNKKEFATRLSQSTTALGGSIDRVDKEVLYYLLFGKQISNRKSIAREFHSDVAMLHFMSDDEKATSEARRTWLNDRITVAEKASELFFSQLKSNDLCLYAERFWDKVIGFMSSNCLHFPFFKWEGEDNHGNKSPKPHAEKKEDKVEVKIGWELYREIILTGMKKHLDQEEVGKLHVSNVGVGNSSKRGDISMKGYVMHSVDHS